MALTNLEWLRRLLQDVGSVQNEVAASNGEVDFFVRNPPMMAGSEDVYVDNVPKNPPGDYTVPASLDRVSFTAPVTAGAQVVIRYSRQNFPDDELEHYLAQAGNQWTASRHVVYQAAIFAIDALLMGTSTALRFGAGAEDFDMPSVDQRLKELRQMLIDYLAAAVESGDADEGSLAIVDTIFDVDDPTFPGDWENLETLP